MMSDSSFATSFPTTTRTLLAAEDSKDEVSDFGDNMKKVEAACEEMKCERGGRCVQATNTDHAVRCQCQLGTTGQHCQRGW